MKKHKTALTIAGSDSGGGAGIQADLKTFSACGCYGMSVITAITAQNTEGVTDIFPVRIATIEKQIDAVLTDIGADAVKVGMLHSVEVIRLVAKKIKQYEVKRLVIDPVMVATSGDKLLQEEAIEALKEELLPLATIITPNIPEASILSGEKITAQSELPDAARSLSCNQSVSVMLKAGHLSDETLMDVLYDAEKDEIVTFPSKRITTMNTHGTGCTLSSAIASFLARGETLQSAVGKGKNYIDQAIQAGKDYKTGHGHGPVHHFFRWWA
ncbi:bifunctional hydroxymethylpyrimidine kinase/phosphomethylpyrimidine kinase [Thermophagus sp. OGC60D27]|uniref:bifunctional hydroxymethylpyrimidine kinase/phosphomethylpyrimidine kinase n=1 Tax=Thermophagus sp. OGC60D27 TaxID=3458415 RepID=UPI004037DFAF